MVTPVVYEPPKCSYFVNDGSIATDGSVHNKVSGTMMAGILGCSPWSTPFLVSCDLLGLGREDISNKPAVKAGQALEGKIIEYVNSVHKDIGTFTPADMVYGKREGDHNSWTPDFDDPVFTGHVDGIVFTDDGEDYILEIKTSGNLDSWKNGVPEYYFWQVALYNEFICKKDKAYVVLGMVDDEARKNPENWVPSEENVVMFEMPIDREMVQARIAEIRLWYEQYILQNTTEYRDLDNKKDTEMYMHLSNLALSSNDIGSMLDEYFELEQEIKAHENLIEAKVKVRDDLKTKIKDFLTAHGMSEMESANGSCVGKISEKHIASLDKEKMIEDGIDVAKYTRDTVQKSFTVKAIRK